MGYYEGKELRFAGKVRGDSHPITRLSSTTETLRRHFSCTPAHLPSLLRPRAARRNIRRWLAPIRTKRSAISDSSIGTRERRPDGVATRMRVSIPQRDGSFSGGVRFTCGGSREPPCTFSFGFMAEMRPDGTITAFRIDRALGLGGCTPASDAASAARRPTPKYASPSPTAPHARIGAVREVDFSSGRRKIQIAS
jgi:hypothetical protein